MRATKNKHQGSASLPPIRATIAAGKNDVTIRISDQGERIIPMGNQMINCAGGGLWTQENQIKSPSDLFSFSHTRNATRMENSRLGALRSISSSNYGMRATVAEQLRRWQQPLPADVDDPEKDAGVGPHPRIGIGLPMSNIFAT